ncbi:response regulator [Brucella intermedia]|uniref:response regulator n=1 Tax=Brucella intermedia TaxID=94625 RepID=UPI00124E0BBC|nr:response regulator [Brucella intermedia]KAB2689880.1 response regulator [Brucella intermedia]
MNDGETTILLIDDEEDLLEVLAVALRNEGYNCLQSSSAAGALKLLDRTPEIDVVVSDIRLPTMCGIELTRRVRERYAERSWLQIIFITGHATLDNSINALRLAAVDYLYKPVRGPELLLSIGKAAGKAKALRTATSWEQQERQQLSLLIGAVQQLSSILDPSSSNPKLALANLTDSAERLPTERLKELVRIRDVRAQFFPGKLFVDPAWHIMLELMENYLAGNTVKAFSLFMVSGVPIATASRRLDEMERSGLIHRSQDPLDGRRQLVALTESAVTLMYSYLTALDQGLKS